MASIIVGQTTGIIYQTSQPLTIATDGTITSVITFKINGSIANNLSSIPTYLAAHPYIPELLAYESQTDQEEGPVTVCTTTYKGTLLTAENESGTQLEFDRATTESPVETHPRFALPRENPPVTSSELTTIELYLQNAENPPDGLLNEAAQSLYNLKRRGIESYLKPGQVFKKTYVRNAIPAGSVIDNVGKITDPPAFAPVAPQGQNYLYLGASWKKQAGVVTIVESYQLSGPGGWDPTLYESA
jgi:hypothetical protein